MKDSKAKGEKVVFFTTSDQLQRIEDFRYLNRITSKSDAVRKLLDIAIDTVNEKKKADSTFVTEMAIAAEQQTPYRPKDQE